MTSPDITPLLTLDGVRVRMRAPDGSAREVLAGVDLRVGRGELLGVIGETGAGKTTLARTVVGLVRASSGSVRFEDVELTALRGRRLRAFRRSGRIQFVFQDSARALDPDLPAWWSVSEGPALRGEADPAARRARAARAFGLAGLEPALLDRRPGELSGGQRQRVNLARALVAEPRLLICDEPVSALDAANRARILALLARLRGELGISLLVISHDLPSMAGVADRIAVLYEGRVVEQGPADEVFSRPEHSYTRLLVAAGARAAARR